MTVLSYHTIEELCLTTRPMITPFSSPEKFLWSRSNPSRELSYGISHCGYDIRLSDENDNIIIDPSSNYNSPFSLAHTLEQFDMPKDVVGIVHDKSTLARMGVAVQNTVIEPGWRGFLTLEITAHRERVVLQPGMPIAQVIFHRMDREVEGYAGKYQDQPNEPVEAM